MNITAKIPVRLVNALNQREHWGARAARANTQRKAACLTMYRAMPAPTMAAELKAGGIDWGSVRFVITITRRGGRRMDDDGLTASAKHVRDGIADYLGIDDGDKRLKWVYAQDKAPKGEHFVTVSIEVE
jgi:hypothetical protein